MTDPSALARFQAGLDVSPFQRWLGLRIVALDPGRIRIALPWREALVSNPATRSVHGGVLASLIDLGGLYAVLSVPAPAISTLDLQTDYHAPATGLDLVAESRVVRVGARVSTASTEIADADGRLIASGRGAYMMRAPAPGDRPPGADPVSGG